ncbi:MAG: hypothetical protein HPY45_09855 [Anaerolineae bacterium]|nr:hypothetical protein [Anaerolineae bacterium]
MRTPAVEKMGYYPTDLPVLEIIKTFIQPAEVRARLLDPCAGEGEAASLLGQALNCETWGVELSHIRAEKAAQALDKVHQAAWQAVYLSDESISLLFLNPPYEADEDHKRVELDFLKSCTPKLARSGLLVYIVPQHILKIETVAKLLAAHYENLRCWRFPDGLFEKFKQVVVFGNRRQILNLPTSQEIAEILRWASLDLPPIEPQSEPLYTLPPAPVRGANGRPVVFKRTDYEPYEIVLAAMKEGVHATREWRDLVSPVRGIQALRPVMPLKKGHIAMLMASGMMGTLKLTDADGKPMLIKGRVVKVNEKVSETENEDGSVTETFRDRYITTIAVARQTGDIEIIQDVEKLTDFMREHGEQIAAHVLETYRPLYNMQPTQQENAVLDTLGKRRSPLPGQKEPGLLPTQRHAAIAMARTLKKNGVGNLQGEMGLGKTTVGAAVIELLNAYPAIVICPPHLVPKWIREIQEVIPGAIAKELRRIGKNGEPGEVNDVRDFLELGKKAVAVVAHTSAKMGSGWKPSFVWRYTTDFKGQRIKACACPVCGRIIKKDDGGIVVPVTNPDDLAKKRLTCQGQVVGWQLDKDGRRRRDEKGNPIWGERTCNAPLYEYSGERRWSIAEYIAKKERGTFKLLIADEVHELKGKSTDRGVAFHQLVTACQRTLTLTGTFFGGKSTSIFWLLHRLNASVRRDFRFDDEKRWANLYGVLETQRRSKKDEEDEDGVWSGNRRYRNMAKELPGVSPAIISRLLDTTIFLNLKDLGLALPAYREEVAALDMLDQQAEQYRKTDSVLKNLAHYNNRYLSMWLQWTLARPNSCFRDEVVTEEIGSTLKPILQLPAINPNGHRWLPKENWLADFCKAERAQGRKVLVYVRQTGTRDIQDRVVEPLKEAGLRTAILNGGVDPRKREEWIERRVHGLDVLVCNAELVKTGLDLVQFSSVVFYEIVYSLYTLWQALRRVWRLGQTKPVKAVFSVYKDTMEERALALMGSKMKAAQLLYGDEVAGAIVPEDDGDVLTHLARDVLAGAELPDLASIFADEMSVSHDPLGSVVTPSAPLPTPSWTQLSWAEWAEKNAAALQQIKNSKRARVPAAQLGLF